MYYRNSRQKHSQVPLYAIFPSQQLPYSKIFALCVSQAPFRRPSDLESTSFDSSRSADGTFCEAALSQVAVPSLIPLKLCLSD